MFGHTVDLILRTVHSAALCSVPLRRLKAFHRLSETGGGLPSGPLLSDGSFIFNEG